jgi:hypothetical protein
MMQQFNTIDGGFAIFDPAGLVSAKFRPDQTIAGLVIPAHIDVKHANGALYTLDACEWSRVQVAMLTPKLET